jgi:hypothetical protein
MRSSLPPDVRSARYSRTPALRLPAGFGEHDHGNAARRRRLAGVLISVRHVSGKGRHLARLRFVAVAGEADIRGATIVAAAAVNDAVVYSQDWGHNRTIDGVRVANPFKAS